MGTTSSQEINFSKIYQEIVSAEANFNSLLFGLNQQLSEILNDLLNRQYIVQNNQVYELDPKLCDRLIYYKVDQFIQNMEPLIINKIAYRLGISTDKNSEDMRNNRQLVCAKFTEYVKLKFEIIIAVYNSLNQCKINHQILKNQITTFGNLSNFQDYSKCLESKNTNITKVSQSNAQKFKKFTTISKNLESLLKKTYNINTTNQLLKIQDKVNVLVTDLDKICTELPTIYECNNQTLSIDNTI